KLAPEKIVDARRRLIEAISRKRLVHVLSRAIEARENPAIFKRLGAEPGNAHVATAALAGVPRPRAFGGVGWVSRLGPQARVNPIHVHEHEARRIPNLVGKIPVPRR